MPMKEVVTSPFPVAARSSVDMESPSWWWPASVGTLILALVLRLAWAAVVPVEPFSDCGVYDQLARNIAAGQGYAFEPGKPTAFWAVGTSAVLAVVYKVFGHDYGYWPVVVLNVLVGVATVWLTMMLSRHWFGALAGLATGLLMAIWPGQIQFTTLTASAPLFNLCVVAALFVESRDRWSPGVRAVLTGVALAAASYVRPVSLLLPAILIWCRLVGPEAGRRRPLAVLAEAAVVVVVMAALIAPWTIRNAKAFGRPVLISTNGGPNLWMGNNPNSTGGYMPLPDEVEGMSEVDREEFLKSQAKEYILENPRAFVVGLAKKWVLLHDRENIGVVWNQEGLIRSFGPGSLTPLKVVSSGYWWGVMLLAFCGVAAALSRLGVVSCLGLAPLVLWGYFMAVHVVVVGGDRYHYPSVPMIAALAGLGAVAVLDRVRARRSKSQSPASSSAV